MEPVAKWDAQHVFLRGPLSQHASGRSQFTGAQHYSMASHDLRDHARRGSGQDSHSAEELNCWTIRPPCPTSSRIVDSVGGSFAQSPPQGIIGDSWRCESNLAGLSGVSCPSRNDSSGTESDASLDEEVASLTSGRRLGFAYNDARLPAEASGRAAAIAGPAMPTTVSPPSRYGTKEPSALFCLLSPSFSQQQPRVGKWAVTPSPTGGQRSEGSRRNASAGSIEVAEESGVAGHVLGGLLTEEPAAKRRRIGSDWDSNNNSSRCRTPLI